MIVQEVVLSKEGNHACDDLLIVFRQVYDTGLAFLLTRVSRIDHTGCKVAYLETAIEGRLKPL